MHNKSAPACRCNRSILPIGKHTCKRMLYTSGCAFSISSKSNTQKGLRRTASVSFPPSPYPTYPAPFCSSICLLLLVPNEHKDYAPPQHVEARHSSSRTAGSKWEGQAGDASLAEAPTRQCGHTWWSPNQLCHRVSLHVLRHVQPQHRISAAKVLLTQNLQHKLNLWLLVTFCHIFEADAVLSEGRWGDSADMTAYQSLR